MNEQKLSRLRANRMVWLIWMAGLGAVTPVFGQRYMEEAIPYRNSARIRTAEGFVDVNFTKRTYTGTAQPQDVYYSYYQDSIYATQGGYHGRPLHGKYIERYGNKGLKVMGSYHYGLKDGKWQYWDKGGELRKVSRWKEGRETGRFAIYNGDGKLQQRGYLLDGKFDGIIMTYTVGHASKPEKKRYRLGIEVGNGEGSWLLRVGSWVRHLLFAG